MVVTLYCTAPSDAVARTLAEGLLAAKLAACVNLLPGGRSLYVWDAQLQDEPETYLLIKTTEPQAAAATAWLVTNHPYDEPCVTGWRCEFGSQPFAAWVASQATGPAGTTE